MTTKTKAARHCCNSDTRQKSTTQADRQIITEYERGTHYVGLILFGMFMFFITWMWFTW